MKFSCSGARTKAKAEERNRHAAQGAWRLWSFKCAVVFSGANCRHLPELKNSDRNVITEFRYLLKEVYSKHHSRFRSRPFGRVERKFERTCFRARRPYPKARNQALTITQPSALLSFAQKVSEGSARAAGHVLPALLAWPPHDAQHGSARTCQRFLYFLGPQNIFGYTRTGRAKHLF